MPRRTEQAARRVSGGVPERLVIRRVDNRAITPESHYVWGVTRADSRSPIVVREAATGCVTTKEANAG